ncbi:MAG: hypothetical protein IT174_10715 [Acidobacteria bacterium]|nr:hypothetical protein [Acidobacteriota bacterium]
MNYILPFTLTGVVITIFVYLWLRKRSAESWHLDPETRGLRLLGQVKPVETPGGHEIYFEEGSGPDFARFGGAIDAGVEKTFRKLECAGYPVDRSKHRIKATVFAAEPSADGSPSFRVPIRPGNPYFNGEFDKMAGRPDWPHYILAAGQTIAVGEPYGDVFIVPYCTEDHLDYLARAAEYEMEHVGLAWYDGEKFEATKYHTTGGHPLVADCPKV